MLSCCLATVKFIIVATHAAFSYFNKHKIKVLVFSKQLPEQSKSIASSTFQIAV